MPSSIMFLKDKLEELKDTGNGAEITLKSGVKQEISRVLNIHGIYGEQEKEDFTVEAAVKADGTKGEDVFFYFLLNEVAAIKTSKIVR